MSLSAGDIYDKDFKKKFTGGYDPTEVDDFLDLIATYYEKVSSENINLKAEIEHLESRIEYYKSSEGELDDTLKKVHKALETTTDKAKEEAAKMLEEAKNRSSKLMSKAKEESEKMLEEAKAERDKLISKAQLKADNATEQAQEKSCEILKEADEKVAKKEEHYKSLLEKERLFRHRTTSFLEEGIDTLSDMLKKVSVELNKDKGEDGDKEEDKEESEKDIW